MTPREQIIEDMAFGICADIRHGLKPQSVAAGRRWIRIAIAWARRNGHRGLEKRLREYLKEAWPVETTLPMRRVPTLPALKAA